MFSLSKIINLCCVRNGILSLAKVCTKCNMLCLKNNNVCERWLNTLEQKLQNDHTLKLATPYDTLRIMKFLRINYAHNTPFYEFLNFNMNISNPVLEEIWLNAILQRYTIIAEKKCNSDIIGVIINKKLCTWDADQLDHLATCISCYRTRQLLHLFALIEREPNFFKKSNNEIVFDMSLLVVNKETDGTLELKLIQESLNYARNIGFKYASVNCTNDKMANYAKLAGMDLIWKFPYNRILDSTGLFIKPEISETYARVFTINL